ncbi:putative membrane protein [Brucella grignonensis]|uniref:Putative membrane protein n=1 Tax=Brucella grignonensis TaxID=94627 RepID=A0A256FEY7_9HYPH|nr:putative membrane protein [Brucella grignonensis]
MSNAVGKIKHIAGSPMSFAIIFSAMIGLNIGIAIVRIAA